MATIRARRPLSHRTTSSKNAGPLRAGERTGAQRGAKEGLLGLLSRPTVSRFYGIVIAMFFDDHPPPHCHARHGGDKARIDIASGGILDGRLSPCAARLVREWVRRHQPELEHNWVRAREMRPLERIEPLP